MLKSVFHTGVAVEDLEASIEQFEKLGFKVTNRFKKPDLNAKAAMLNKGEANYELFEFSDTSHPQFVFISNHIAFYSDDLEADLADFVERGYNITIPITEGITVRYVYVQDSVGTNIELATEKAS